MPWHLLTAHIRYDQCIKPRTKHERFVGAHSIIALGHSLGKLLALFGLGLNEAVRTFETLQSLNAKFRREVTKCMHMERGSRQACVFQVCGSQLHLCVRVYSLEIHFAPSTSVKRSLESCRLFAVFVLHERIRDQVVGNRRLVEIRFAIHLLRKFGLACVMLAISTKHDERVQAKEKHPKPMKIDTGMD